MGEAAKILEKRYTYGDYRTWDDGLRWELIDGEAFCMSPGPGTAHQFLAAKLFTKLGSYFEGKECQAFFAPFDVMLPRGEEPARGQASAGRPEDEVDTVVQPDIMILCDMSKLQHNGIKGAPDVIIEILSPSTTQRDLDDKFRLYERVGVKEYVIVDPLNYVIFVHRRDAGGLYSFRKVCGADDVLEFGMFPELKIPLSPIWEDIRDLPIAPPIAYQRVEYKRKMTIHEKICDAIGIAASKYNIKAAYYFGSYATGRQTEGSDIDLLVEFRNPFVSLFAISSLSFELEKLLQTSVDIISLPLPEDTHLIIEKQVQCYGE